VYGQQQGEWVDEQSPAAAAGFSGRVMGEAEQVALHSAIPATVVRLSGLYGPGRQRLIKQVQQGYRVAAEPPLYGNRIHVEDAAGLLAFLLQADARGVALEDCYLGVDDEPAALHEVLVWLRAQLGVSHWAEESTLGRVGSKRCSNARARALGWAPQYPSYREGYAAVLASLAGP
jgi:nucleoside-diphosphate-sugar epimerase